MRTIFCASILLFVSCVPTKIKTQIDFVDTVTQTAAKETEGYTAASEAEKAAMGEKAVRAIHRLKLHTDNLKRWIDRKEPASE